jgi:SAM-dependent methyltransferase
VHPPQALDHRKRRGDYATPLELVDAVVERAVGPLRPGQVVRVLDPACGDGRFLVAAGRRIQRSGGRPELLGVDIHPGAVRQATDALARAGLAGVVAADDALTREWSAPHFDVVVGNPPYLSQLAAATTRGRASHHGGGPYADAAAEFLALAVRLAVPGGRIGLVLPQSILASRDAGPVRADVDRAAELIWSWWSPRRIFDADVTVCALVFERRTRASGPPAAPWNRVVTEALGVPALPALEGAGTLGDRARLTANFRDQYYGLVGAVIDDPSPDRSAGADGSAQPPLPVPGPRLVTSGLIDPARCAWGERPIRFAGRRYDRPRVAMDALSPSLSRWARALLVPKVLIANQTAVIEAVADVAGAWLPAVPVLTARPWEPSLVGPVAAVLTSPVASCWAWHRAAGTGLSARAVRLGPRWLGELPWPAGDLTAATAAYRAGDVEACGRAVQAAYGVSDEALHAWWMASAAGRR